MRKSPLMAVLSALFILSGPVQAASAPASSSLTKASLTVGQPGVVALQRMNEQALSSPQQVTDLVNTMVNEDTYKRMFSRLKKNETAEAAEVLLALQDGQSLSTFLNQQSDAQNARSLVRAAMVLFPLDRYDLYRSLKAEQQFDQKALKKWASSTGLMTQPMYPKSMTEGKAIFVEPLIESASITLPNQTRQASASVEYRVKGSEDEKWQKGRELVWEPVQGVLTGPLVYLKPDTRYEVKVALTTAEGKQQTLAHEFTTRADKPPIDPNKVYYLSDIYQGGTLDLEKLKINGSDSGWAKIVNDKDITIEAGKGDRYAIDIGKAHHVYFENIKVRGGRVHAIYAEQAHHIWINQCDIAAGPAARWRACGAGTPARGSRPRRRRPAAPGRCCPGRRRARGGARGGAASRGGLSREARVSVRRTAGRGGVFSTVTARRFRSGPRCGRKWGLCV